MSYLVSNHIVIYRYQNETTCILAKMGHSPCQMTFRRHVDDFCDQHQRRQRNGCNAPATVGPAQLADTVEDRTKREGGTNGHVIPTLVVIDGYLDTRITLGTSMT